LSGLDSFAWSSSEIKRSIKLCVLKGLWKVASWILFRLACSGEEEEGARTKEEEECLEERRRKWAWPRKVCGAPSCTNKVGM
jgi:hypothetical protein